MNNRSNIIIWGLLSLALLLIFWVVFNAQKATRYNMALNRVQLCILSTNAVTRNQQHIEVCYQDIEEAMNLEIERDDHKDTQ